MRVLSASKQLRRVLLDTDEYGCENEDEDCLFDLLISFFLDLSGYWSMIAALS